MDSDGFKYDVTLFTRAESSILDIRASSGPLSKINRLRSSLDFNIIMHNDSLKSKAQKTQVNVNNTYLRLKRQIDNILDDKIPKTKASLSSLEDYSESFMSDINDFERQNQIEIAEINEIDNNVIYKIFPFTVRDENEERKARMVVEGRADPSDFDDKHDFNYYKLVYDCFEEKRLRDQLADWTGGTNLPIGSTSLPNDDYNEALSELDKCLEEQTMMVLTGLATPNSYTHSYSFYMEYYYTHMFKKDLLSKSETDYILKKNIDLYICEEIVTNQLANEEQINRYLDKFCKLSVDAMTGSFEDEKFLFDCASQIIGSGVPLSEEQRNMLTAIVYHFEDRVMSYLINSGEAVYDPGKMLIYMQQNENIDERYINALESINEAKTIILLSTTKLNQDEFKIPDEYKDLEWKFYKYDKKKQKMVMTDGYWRDPTTEEKMRGINHQIYVASINDIGGFGNELILFDDFILDFYNTPNDDPRKYEMFNYLSSYLMNDGYLMDLSIYEGRLQYAIDSYLDYQNNLYLKALCDSSLSPSEINHLKRQYAELQKIGLYMYTNCYIDNWECDDEYVASYLDSLNGLSTKAKNMGRETIDNLRYLSAKNKIARLEEYNANKLYEKYGPTVSLTKSQYDSLLNAKIDNYKPLAKKYVNVDGFKYSMQELGSSWVEGFKSAFVEGDPSGLLDALKQTGATIVTGGICLVGGLIKPFENLVDGTINIGVGIGALFTSIFSRKKAKSMMNWAYDFAAEDFSKKAVTFMLNQADNALNLQEYSAIGLDSPIVDEIIQGGSRGLELTAALLLGTCTCGATTLFIATTVGFVEGYGQGVEKYASDAQKKAKAEGKDVEYNFATGTFSSLGSGFEMAVQWLSDAAVGQNLKSFFQKGGFKNVFKSSDDFKRIFGDLADLKKINDKSITRLNKILETCNKVSRGAEYVSKAADKNDATTWNAKSLSAHTKNILTSFASYIPDTLPQPVRIAFSLIVDTAAN